MYCKVKIKLSEPVTIPDRLLVEIQEACRADIVYAAPGEVEIAGEVSNVYAIRAGLARARATLAREGLVTVAEGWEDTAYTETEEETERG